MCKDNTKISFPIGVVKFKKKKKDSLELLPHTEEERLSEEQMKQKDKKSLERKEDWIRVTSFEPSIQLSWYLAFDF